MTMYLLSERGSLSWKSCTKRRERGKGSRFVETAIVGSGISVYPPCYDPAPKLDAVLAL